MKTDPHDHSQKISIFGCQTGRHFGFLATAGAEEKILRPQLKNLKQSTAWANRKARKEKQSVPLTLSESPESPEPLTLADL